MVETIWYMNFIGIISMPEFMPMQVLVLDSTQSGMCFIEHPQGYYSERFKRNVLFVSIKEHLRQFELKWKPEHEV